VWTLDRPAALNSLSPDLVAALDRACADVENDPAVRSVVLRGRGRAFCAGGDLVTARAARDRGEAGAYFATISGVLTRIADLPVPTVAAVHGWAVAGGLELVLCCDLVVATASARFGDGHARYGLVPGGGGSVRLPRRIGAARARWLLFTGEDVGAATAEHWGLVARTVADDGLDAAVGELVATLGLRSRDGLRTMKELLDAGADRGVDDALAAETDACARHTGGADAGEGMAAFAEKRTPRFGVRETVPHAGQGSGRGSGRDTAGATP
jgi:enoyl-CoA hydratase/carnithine racemase